MEIISTTSPFLFLEKYLPELEDELKKGSLIVVDDNKLRIRLLPLDSKSKK